MGKAQSKRSVDITTETKKSPDGGDEVTGKLEKIEDIDQKQVNGDATPQEKNDAAGEKKDAPDETENEKDLTTEKTAEENAVTPTTDGGDQANTTATESSPKEDASGATAAGATKEGEEISPLADESLNKKSKKKKWSFRSISFGKKDKQKPAKTEGSENVAAGAATTTVENAEAATNGDASETNKPTEGADANATKHDDLAPTAAAAEEVKPVEGEKLENGDAAEKEQQQMNGQKTPTPTDETEEKKPIETSTAVVNETATVAITAVTTPAPATSSNETADASHSDMKTTPEKIEAVVSNGTAETENNGDVHANEHDDQQNEEKTTAQSEDINKSIPVDEKPHQNGTNGDDGVEEITAATKTLQIEVKTEHQIDSVNSTTNTITTTTTTIPADNFNSEQKTTTDNFLITSVQTDIHTNTNTSDKSLSSNNSIAITEEHSDNHPKTVLDTVEEVSKLAVEPESSEINPNESNEQADVPQQQPPPLPLSAPPSQVLIFALKDNGNNSDAISQVTSTSSVENNIENELKSTLKDLSTSPLASSSEKIQAIETEEIIERGEILEAAAEPINTAEKENSLCFSEETAVELKNCNLNEETEVIESISTEDIASKSEDEGQTNESSDVLDDFAAEALIILDQIQKDLKKEDDDSQHQESESERSLNDNAEITEKLSHIEAPIANSELLTDMISNHEQIIDDYILQNVSTTPPNNSETTEAQNKIELESALSSLSKIKDEIEVPITIPEETSRLEIELNTQHLEQEHEQRQSHQIADQTIEKDEKSIETTQEDNDKDCSHKNESIEFSIDANGDNKTNVIGINDNDEEFIDSSNKEIPTAKDLKENAAAAEITTQDLPVTCE